MTVKCTVWVFEQAEATGNDRLVLHAIADEADDDGRQAFPSLDRIAAKVRLPKRSVMRCLVRLEESGELIVLRPPRRGRGLFNRYVLPMGRSDDTLTPVLQEELALVDPGTRKARKGAERRADMPDPSQTHRPIEEPQLVSEEPRARSEVPKRRKAPLSEPFMLTLEMHQWAKDNVPSVNVRTETAKFCDHWRGNGELKADWLATWRNWMRRAAEYASRGNAPRAGPDAGPRLSKSRQNLDRLMERMDDQGRSKGSAGVHGGELPPGTDRGSATGVVRDADAAG